jgi:SpoVK/Ycf46/Vps4 family AAA+-type ATPase
MSDYKDLEMVVNSRIPLIVVETYDEQHALEMITRLAIGLQKTLHCWSVTQGLQHLGFGLVNEAAAGEREDPEQVLQAIKSHREAGVYVLCDYHPYLKGNPTNIRLLKDIALNHKKVPHTVILLSHSCDIPAELTRLAARFRFAMPTEEQLMAMVREEARHWSQQHGQVKVRTDNKTLEALLKNLRGLTHADSRRLIHTAICDDGAINATDLPAINKAKYQLLNQENVLSFEYDTSEFSEVGGLANLKRWLENRKNALLDPELVSSQSDGPKGILLLGVQGAGKSLAAKAVAGMWHLPLLRLDFAVLYNKFIGETEKNLREALQTAELMAPCVLWLDEIEKGIHAGHSDDGTSRRVLGSFLTWLAEKTSPVFVVATANSVEQLPPELLRKGRLDEIFFVDLPDEEQRKEIFEIHLQKREKAPGEFDIEQLAALSDGFSGAEIEQAIVSGLYRVAAAESALTTEHVIQEIGSTVPLSLLMAEKVQALRNWAADRTVSAN